MSLEIGMAVGLEVGSHASLVSVGGSAAHQAQLAAGLNAAGVHIDNAPKGPLAEFATANAKGYADPVASAVQPALNHTLSHQM